MQFRSLSWRIGVPFAAFVLTGSVIIVLLIHEQAATENRERFLALGATNAAFLEKANLPLTARLAENLTEVLGVDVAFRTERGIITAIDGAPSPTLERSPARIPSDGEVHRVGDSEAVAVRLRADTELLLSRPISTSWGETWRASTIAILAAFWILAAVVGWVVGRALVRPLRTLAAQLPQIEQTEPLDLSAAARTDEIGDVARAFLRTREALQAEREHAEQAEKLAVLGRMTAALAHEIQNPVAAIKMHAQLWKQAGVSDAATPALIEREAERIDDLLSQWLFVGRPEPPVTSLVSLADLLEQTITSHRSQLDHANVKASLDAPADVRTQGDAKRLLQVFRNLLINAIQAMPRGGDIVIRVIASEHDRAEVRFEDTGRGFSSAALERSSEFFFSEKEGGMGIGLSVSRAIAEAHGGTLKVANRVADGAVVTVALPLDESPLETDG